MHSNLKIISQLCPRRTNVIDQNWTTKCHWHALVFVILRLETWNPPCFVLFLSVPTSKSSKTKSSTTQTGLTSLKLILQAIFSLARILCYAQFSRNKFFKLLSHRKHAAYATRFCFLLAKLIKTMMSDKNKNRLNIEIPLVGMSSTRR